MTFIPARSRVSGNGLHTKCTDHSFALPARNAESLLVEARSRSGARTGEGPPRFAFGFAKSAEQSWLSGSFPGRPIRTGDTSCLAELPLPRVPHWRGMGSRPLALREGNSPR